MADNPGNPSSGQDSHPEDRGFRLKTWHLVCIAVAIMIATWAAAGGLIAYIWPGITSNEARDSARLEFISALLQVAVIGVIGGGITALYAMLQQHAKNSREDAEKRREQEKLRAEARSKFLMRLGEAYRSAKGARRYLRVDGVSPATLHDDDALTEDQIAAYSKHMAVINKVQLNLEAMKIEARFLPEIQDIGGVAGDIKKMEEYLGDIMDEYEENRPKPTIHFGDLRRIREFTQGTDTDVGYMTPFHQIFTPSYRNLVENVGKHSQGR